MESTEEASEGTLFFRPLESMHANLGAPLKLIKLRQYLIVRRITQIDYCESVLLLKVPWIQLIMRYNIPTCNPKVN